MKPKVKIKPLLSVLEQAIALQHDGNLTGAKQLFLKIVAKEPGNAAALYSLAAIESAQNDYQKALGYIQQSRREEAGKCPIKKWQICPSDLETHIPPIL